MGHEISAGARTLRICRRHGRLPRRFRGTGPRPAGRRADQSAGGRRRSTDTASEISAHPGGDQSARPAGARPRLASAALGNVVGPMIGYEVLVAFFLEATFLGVLLFGWNRVPPWLADGQRDVVKARR